MNKDRKTYVEPNMKVMEVEAEAMMAGSDPSTCAAVYNPPVSCETEDDACE